MPAPIHRHNHRETLKKKGTQATIIIIKEDEASSNRNTKDKNEKATINLSCATQTTRS